MSIIYHVTIEAAKKENIFHIKWTDNKKEVHGFDQSAYEIMPEEMEWMWKDRRNQLRIGEKLFRFLDGEGNLQRALKEADNHSETLQLHLSPCPETSNWPFELLAQNDSFLLPDRLQLVRSVQAQTVAEELPSQNRRLRLLFMACSPLDVQSELDFEKEEEAIFKITEKLAIDMEVEDTGSLEGLRQKLQHRQYDIVHLSGYAGIDKKTQPFFVMESETGCRQDVSAEKLWHKALRVNPPQLLFISGNSTGDAPEGTEGAFAHMLIEKYQIPAVLGWGRWISDGEANEAAQVIYKELSRGKSVLDAVQRARYQLINRYPSTLKPAWPQLRLFSSGGTLDAMVTSEQKRQPQTRRMTHVHLKNSEVKVLLEGFVGRRRQLQQSFRALTQEPGKIGLLILGTGGLGKSCLAGKVSERFKEHALIIIHGRLNSLSLKRALKDAFIVARDEHGKSVLSWEMEMKDILGVLCRSCFKDKKYLILLDDFEQNLESSDKGEPGGLFPEAVELLKVLLDCLPGTGKNTQMMITCRYGFSVTVKDLDPVKERLEWIWLAGFREPEQKKKVGELPHILKQKEPSTIDKLLAAGCGNPRLMEWLDVLVGQMKASEVPELLQAVHGKKREFIQKHVIRELLEKGGDDLTRFLQWFAIYRRPVLKKAAKEVGQKAGLKTWNDLLRRGMDLSLIEHDHARLSYQGTPLLREEFLKELEDQHACHEAAFTYYKKICDDKPEEQFDPIQVEEWVYHALGCGEEDVASREGSKLVNYMNESMAFLESLHVGTSILENKKQQLLTKYDASLLNSLAYSLEDLGEPMKAVKLYQKALTIDETILGREHPNVGIRLNNIGSAWQALGEQKKAIEYFEQALTIWKNLPGEMNQDAVYTLNNLGIAWQALADYQKAGNYFQEALKIDEELHGRKHPDVATRLNNLGGLCRELGDLKEAIDYYQEALDIDKNFFGPEHHRTAIRLNNLGETWRLLGEPNKALGYYQESLAINTAVFGLNHPMTALSQSNLGSTYIELNDYRNAISYLEQALKIFKDVYGNNHKNTSSVLGNLGLAWKELGDLKKAAFYIQEAYRIDKDLFGMKHPDVTTDLNNLASLYIDLGDYKKAVKYSKQALSIDKELFGKNHLNVAFSLNILGLVQDKLGQHQKAIDNFQEALSIWKEVKGEEKHPLIADLLNNLGSAWGNLGHHQKAINYYQAALKIDRSVFGPRHPDVAARLSNIGSAWQDIGDHNKAVDYYQEALVIDKTVFGPEHPNVARNLHNLGTAYFKLGQKDLAKEHITKAYAIFNKFYGPKHPNMKTVAGVLEKLKEGK